MQSTRQQKINRLIQKELGDIFQNDTKQMRGVFITVSEVRTTPDLGLSRAYLSVFPDEKGKELIENIQANVKRIRYDLGTRIGKQLRAIPNLEFHLDNSLEYLERIDELLAHEKEKEAGNAKEEQED